MPFSRRFGRNTRPKRQTELTLFDAGRRPYCKVVRYFASAAFFAAQRFLTASAIRFRPSGERFLFFFFAGFVAAGATAAAFLGAAATFFGLPGRFFAAGAAVPPLSLIHIYERGC